MDLKWDSSLNTGVLCFDEEHRTILKMLNMLREFVRSGKRKDAKDFANRVIIPYLISHLRHEEEIMSLYRFPEYERHVRAHFIVERLFRETLESAPDREMHNLKHFQAIALGWLFGHIVKTDKKYGEFFKKQGLIDKVGSIEPVKPPAGLL
ncbi:MAG: hemerythrin domain-containing protein [Aquificota bacterium]|nr:hemerythrin domain-containing protein [Aquificota bacterium]